MGLWRSLETLTTPAAVLAEWRMLTGDEFDRSRPFLRPTDRQSDTFPCTHRPGCGDRHEVEAMKDGVTFCAVSRNDVVNCRPIALKPHDVVIHELDALKLCAAIRAALRFEAVAADGIGGGSRAHRVGVRGAARSPVLLTLAASESLLLREIEGLLALVSAPFILLAPTATHCTLRVEGVLRRNFCAFIPLSSALAPGEREKLVVTESIDGIMAEFDRSQAMRGAGLVKTVERIDRNMEAVANQNQELRTDNARLKQMQAEGLFAFAKKIDPETLAQFFTILALGDVAKACRELGLSDSTLRSKIAGWRDRGKAYSVLWEIVRWRKSIHGQAGMEFAKRVASGLERDVDYPALIRDVLGELESFNSDNWAEKCDGLETLLRTGVS